SGSGAADGRTASPRPRHRLACAVGHLRARLLVGARRAHAPRRGRPPRAAGRAARRRARRELEAGASAADRLRRRDAARRSAGCARQARCVPRHRRRIRSVGRPPGGAAHAGRAGAPARDARQLEGGQARPRPPLLPPALQGGEVVREAPHRRARERVQGGGCKGSPSPPAALGRAPAGHDRRVPLRPRPPSPASPSADQHRARRGRGLRRQGPRRRGPRPRQGGRRRGGRRRGRGGPPATGGADGARGARASTRTRGPCGG
ncbi:hypothetical protein EMIHUDRAFT_453589, partial [Emiliania huxleyi CCMP1516]|uniref:Uncharacterized protein n=2 Tax=Emiliania huxleyi TaxID=2903 RepID=A0A0D3I402_EMIH1